MNPKTLEEVGILRGDTNLVTCLLKFEDKIVSGSCDKTIRIWDFKTKEQVDELKGHTYWVNCLLLLEYTNREKNYI